MSKAFVLINCTFGKEDEILDELREIEGITEISKTYGVYDIVTKVEYQTEQDLNEIISVKIREIEPVDAVLTLQVN